MPARPNATAAPTPGDALLHPLVVAALALLLLNDHYLKAVAPGLLTGKLSDFAGLAFFPTLLVGAWEIILARAGRWERPGIRALTFAIAATACAFTLAKTVPPVADLIGWLLGGAQWLISLAPRLLVGEPLPLVRRGALLVDPTDLVALIALAIPVWIGFRRARSTRREGVATLAPASAAR